jgi:hypothetical protein
MEDIIVKSVEHISRQLMEAWKKGDYEKMNDLLHKDFQFISTTISGYRYNKMQWLEVAINKYKIFHYKYEFLSIKESDDLVVSVSQLSMLSSTSFNGQTNKYLVTDVWKSENGLWKILLRQPELVI